MRGALLLALVLPLAACSGGEQQDPERLTVLAAASLTDVYEELAEGFEAEHGVEVTFSFGSSTELAQQAAEGAPGDVLSTADESSMAVPEEAGVTGPVTVFASNVLVIATPAGNPAGVDSLADLAGTTWVRCADEVPCGRVALEVLGDHGVTAEPVSLEEDARATLDKVVSGEADAGLVYATDAAAVGDAVTVVEIPGAGRHPASYAVAALGQSESPDLANAWIDLMTSAEGRRALVDAGFDLP